MAKYEFQLRDEMTIGQLYDPTMTMTDPDEAAAYFEALVERNMRFGNSREEAEKIERSNLGYYSGYGDSETMRRVNRMFGAVHPIFGANFAPTFEEALQAGYDKARREIEEESDRD